MTKTGCRQSLRWRRGPSQRSGVVRRHLKVCNVDVIEQRQHRVVGWVLDHVKRNVTEVSFVRDAITAANTGATVAINVPRKANAGREVVSVRFPETTDCTILHDLHTAVANA